MNKHAPIKRHQSLVGFSKDHHFGLLLVWKIGRGLNLGVSPERISNYVLYFFAEDLEKHFKEEEANLFPKLPADNSLRRRAEREHALVYDLVDQLRHEKTNEDLLLRFAEVLKKHIRFEERELFVYMQQTLSATELEAIADHGDSRGEEIDARWDDIFWLADQSKC